MFTPKPPPKLPPLKGPDKGAPLYRMADRLQDVSLTLATLCTPEQVDEAKALTLASLPPPSNTWDHRVIALAAIATAWTALKGLIREFETFEAKKN